MLKIKLYAFILIFLLTQFSFSQNSEYRRISDKLQIKCSDNAVKSDIIVGVKGDTAYTDKVEMERYFSRIHRNGKYKIEKNGKYVQFELPGKNNVTLEYHDNGIKETLELKESDSICCNILSNLDIRFKEKSLFFYKNEKPAFYIPELTAKDSTGKEIELQVSLKSNRLIIKIKNKSDFKYPVYIDPSIYLYTFSKYYSSWTRSDYPDNINNASSSSFVWGNTIRPGVLFIAPILENFRKIKLDSFRFGFYSYTGTDLQMDLCIYPIIRQTPMLIDSATYNDYRKDKAWGNKGGDYYFFPSSDTVNYQYNSNEWFYFRSDLLFNSVVLHDSANNGFILRVLTADSQFVARTYNGIKFEVFWEEIERPDTFTVSAVDTDAFEVYLGTGAGIEYVNLQVKTDTAWFYIDSLGNKTSEKSKHCLFGNTAFDSSVISPNKNVMFRAQKDSCIYESDWDTLSIFSLAAIPDSVSLSSFDENFIYLKMNQDNNPDSLKYCIFDDLNGVYYDTLGNDTSGIFWAGKSSWTRNDSIYIKLLTGQKEYRFKIKAKNSDDVETPFSETKYVVTFLGVVKPMSPSVFALNDSQFQISVVDTFNDIFNDVTYSLKDTINHFRFDTSGNKIDTIVYKPKTSWENVIVSGYLPNQYSGFVNAAMDSLGMNKLFSDQADIFSLTQKGSLQNVAAEDSILLIIFNSDENDDSVKYILKDTISGNYFNHFGDSAKIVFKFLKADFDTIKIAPSHPNRQYIFVTGSYNSDSLFSGYSKAVEVWSQVFVPKIDSVKVINKDSVFLKISFPADNPDYSLYCIEDSVTGQLFRISSSEFDTCTGYPVWCWFTKSEFGENGFFMLTDPGRKYVIRIYAKEGREK